jgi:hypothetical protein
MPHNGAAAGKYKIPDIDAHPIPGIKLSHLVCPFTFTKQILLFQCLINYME